MAHRQRAAAAWLALAAVVLLAILALTTMPRVGASESELAADLMVLPHDESLNANGVEMMLVTEFFDEETAAEESTESTDAAADDMIEPEFIESEATSTLDDDAEAEAESEVEMEQQPNQPNRQQQQQQAQRNQQQQRQQQQQGQQQGGQMQQNQGQQQGNQMQQNQQAQQQTVSSMTQHERAVLKATGGVKFHVKGAPQPDQKMKFHVAGAKDWKPKKKDVGKVAFHVKGFKPKLQAKAKAKAKVKNACRKTLSGKKLARAMRIVGERARARAAKRRLSPAKTRAFVLRQQQKFYARHTCGLTKGKGKNKKKLTDPELKKLFQRIISSQSREAISKLQAHLKKQGKGPVVVKIKSHRIKVAPRTPRAKKVKKHLPGKSAKNYLEHLEQTKAKLAKRIRLTKAKIHQIGVDRLKQRNDWPIEYALLDPPDESAAAAAQELYKDLKPFLKDAVSVKEQDLTEGKENLETAEAVRWQVYDKLEKAKSTPLLPEMYRFLG